MKRVPLHLPPLFVAAGIFASGLPAPPPAYASASALLSAQSATPTPSEPGLVSLLSRINAHRTHIGCSKLVWHEPTAGSAQAHSDDMSRRRYFDHASPEGVTFDLRLKRAGVTSRGLSSENLALTPAGPQSVMEMWMESPGHRRNLDNCSFTAVGIGERDGLWTAVFVTRPVVNTVSKPSWRSRSFLATSRTRGYAAVVLPALSAARR